MRAIAGHGDERAIEPVCDRVRVILARQRKLRQMGGSELLLALRFLARYRDDRARAALRWVTGHRLAYLAPDEADWVRANLLTRPVGTPDPA